MEGKDEENSSENSSTLSYQSIHMQPLPGEYPLHKCAFEGDYENLTELLKYKDSTWNPEIEISRKDKHGNTPLHLAIMQGNTDCVDVLLANEAPIKVKNNDGWTPLAEAISYGNRGIISDVYLRWQQESKKHVESRRTNVVRALREMKDFYMELKWDFASWVPLVSRMLPSDICRIHKCGSSLRFDTTLVDFNDMRWERGNISFIFRGDKPPGQSLTVLDNEFQCFQQVSCATQDFEEEIDMLMSTDILSAQMSTKSVQFQRAQSGWIFREDRKELVSGQFQCDLYTVQGLVLKQRKRREHLSNEDLQKNRAIYDSLKRGRRSSLSTISNDSIVTSEIIRRPSLQPPPRNNITWKDYVTADVGKCPQLGRRPVHKQTNKTIRATVAMSKDFPLSVDMLLNVLEIITPIKHVSKLREFVALKLPAGFPVKLEIPILHTVSAKVTFQKFEFRDNIPEALFEVPSHYIEDNRRFPDL